MSEKALELAYRYLSRRERTVRELRDHLVSRDIDGAAVDAAVQELTETGYLDDARYARLFAQDRRRLDQWGSGRIRRSLLARGVEADLVDEALSEREDAPEEDASADELGRAVALLQQRFPQPPADRRERERALGVLVRRGYEPELALDAIAQHSRGPR